MPTSFVAPTWSFISPADGDLGKIIAQFFSLVPATSSTRSMVYGWTDPQTFESVLEAQKRGVDSRGLCDRSQSIGTVESKNLTAFFEASNRWDNNGNPLWVIGTSDVGDQIIHAKTVWANWNETNTLPYTTMPPSFTDWTDFVKAGYPTVLRGSYNWSTTASRQVNTIDITPSPELCNMYQLTFNRVKDYNIKHNPQWNTKPAVVPTLKSVRFVPDDQSDTV